MVRPVASRARAAPAASTSQALLQHPERESAACTSGVSGIGSTEAFVSAESLGSVPAMRSTQATFGNAVNLSSTTNGANVAGCAELGENLLLYTSQILRCSTPQSPPLYLPPR